MRHIVVFTGLLVAVVFLGMGCAPMPAFQASAEKTNAPATINFTNQSKKALTYEWNFGDGTYSAEPSPSHSYLTSGSYTVTLKARKGNKEQQFSKTITIEPPVECLIKLETEYGNIVIRLSNATPKHRDNFIKLVEEGYYNDLLFHRVIKNFMIQGGDPNSRNARPNVQLGVGGPGYTVPAELIDSLVHIKGALAAARQGDAVNPTKASSGSQFYIVQGNKLTDAMLNQIEERGGFKYSQAQREAYLQHGGTPFLDRQYTVFGQVIEGLDVIDKIAAAPTQPGDRPVKDIKMKLSVMK